MYLSPEEVHRLLARLAKRYEGASLVFDAVPGWLARRSRAHGIRTASGYEPPAWSWGLDRGEERRLRATAGVAALRPLRVPRGRGAAHGLLLPLASRAPVLRWALFSVWQMRYR
jgi:O-methyltransferase involved in polyketide biosynthesis